VGLRGRLLDRVLRDSLQRLGELAGRLGVPEDVLELLQRLSQEGIQGLAVIDGRRGLLGALSAGELDQQRRIGLQQL
jgi:hypothetical protein